MIGLFLGKNDKVWWSKIDKSRVSKEQKIACLVTERERDKKLNSVSSIGNDKRSFFWGVSEVLSDLLGSRSRV